MDKTCDICHGAGEFYTHTEDCRSDWCALAGGMDDCVGQVLDCPECTPTPPRSHPMQDEVTQADRDAAADFMEHKCLPGDLTPTNIRFGNLDDGFAVQAFARHRIEAARPVQSELVEALEAWSDVVAERKRQIEREGYTPEHDDHHDRDNALARAAACYALAGTGGSGPFWVTHLQTSQQVWPYRWEWKPSDRRRNLVKAAALLLAEIERMDRALVAKATGDGLS